MKRASERFDEAVPVTTIDARAGRRMTPFAVLPGLLPRAGETIEIESGVTWTVERVAWTGHPDALVPTLYLLPNQ